MNDTFCDECDRLMKSYRYIVTTDRVAALEVLREWDAHRDAMHGSGRRRENG